LIQAKLLVFYFSAEGFLVIAKQEKVPPEIMIA